MWIVCVCVCVCLCVCEVWVCVSVQVVWRKGLFQLALMMCVTSFPTNSRLLFLFFFRFMHMFLFKSFVPCSGSGFSWNNNTWNMQQYLPVKQVTKLQYRNVKIYQEQTTSKKACTWRTIFYHRLDMNGNFGFCQTFDHCHYILLDTTGFQCNNATKTGFITITLYTIKLYCIS